MQEIEHVIGMRARDAAIRAARLRWLPKLNRWHAAQEEGPRRAVLGMEIKRLRRALDASRLTRTGPVRSPCRVWRGGEQSGPRAPDRRNLRTMSKLDCRLIASARAP